MNKYLLAPDSFKGTMTSREVCAIMEREILAFEPGARVEALPVADGGEGSVDCFLQAAGGERVIETVTGPFPGESVACAYALLPGGKTAVVELAACAGLPLAGKRKDPFRATTYGVGQLMLAAAARGAREIILCLGGSATNDGGCGMAAAAGVRFRNAAGESFVPTGGTLCDIASIDASGLDERLRNVAVTAMCDIDNPMHGKEGAAHVFAPQKGANARGVALLDAGLVALDGVIQNSLGLSVASLPGSGAAGAVGAGAAAFFGAKLKPGIETMLDAVDFDKKLPGARLVFTGEGRLDGQSLRGKVVVGVARRAKAAGVPVIAVVGDIADDAEPVYAEGVSGILSINRLAVDYEKARLRAKKDLALTMNNFFRMQEGLSRYAP